MNEKFFSLPKERQEAMINAGFRVFSQNSYRKSPMSEIAEAAGLLFTILGVLAAFWKYCKKDILA